MKAVKRQLRLGTDAWREAVARFAESGLSVRAFCLREGISDSSFNRWRKRLHDSAVPRPAAKPGGAMVARGGFVDLGTLSAPAGASKSERIELRLDLGGGLLLHLVRG